MLLGMKSSPLLLFPCMYVYVKGRSDVSLREGNPWGMLIYLGDMHPRAPTRCAQRWIHFLLCGLLRSQRIYIGKVEQLIFYTRDPS